MANHKSALKRIRQNEKRRIRNKDVRSNVRTTIKKFETAITGNDLDSAENLFRQAESDLHRAVSKGVIPRARAARKTSRLALRLNAARAAK